MSAGVGRRPGQGPGSVYVVVAVSLFAVLSVLALTPANSTPPAIAEFAPQPREQIKDAPAEQSSDFGSGEGGDTGPQVAGRPTVAPPSPTPSLSAEPPVAPGARVRRCVGNPPRQTEDPQSPPCVAFWAGADNGGATSKGVTGDSITIAVPYIRGGPGQTATEMTRQVRALETFFNSRFEFYGRKLRLVKTPGKGEDYANPEPSVQAADAVRVDQEYRAFASMPYADQGGAEYYYYDELARRRIISVYPAIGTAASEEKLESKHPYQWGVFPPTETMAANIGEWACKNLKGRATQWSGSAFKGQPRKYGIITSAGPDGTVQPIDPLRKRFKECGITIATEVEVPYTNVQDQARIAVLALSREGITTVFPWTHAASLFLAIYPAAEQAQYFPEWVITSSREMDEDSVGLMAPRSQAEHSFGLRFENKNRPQADIPANWAIHEADPGAGNIDLANEKYIYQPLMVLASGIQAAGPHLTPRAFGDALRSLRFPNPAAGAAPWYQAAVGFGPNDHTWFNDATPIYWNPSTTSRQVEQPTGAYCYVRSGRRYSLGGWPDAPADLFTFEKPCY